MTERREEKKIVKNCNDLSNAIAGVEKFYETYLPQEPFIFVLDRVEIL